MQKVPLLNHHTSGVRMEWYRDDLDEARSRDPFPKLKKELLDNDFSEDDLKKLKKENNQVKIDYEKALKNRRSKSKRFIYTSGCSYSYYRRKRRKKTK